MVIQDACSLKFKREAFKNLFVMLLTTNCTTNYIAVNVSYQGQYEAVVGQ